MKGGVMKFLIIVVGGAFLVPMLQHLVGIELTTLQIAANDTALVFWGATMRHFAFQRR